MTNMLGRMITFVIRFALHPLKHTVSAIIEASPDHQAMILKKRSNRQSSLFRGLGECLQQISTTPGMPAAANSAATTASMLSTVTASTPCTRNHVFTAGCPGGRGPLPAVPP